MNNTMYVYTGDLLFGDSPVFFTGFIYEDVNRGGRTMDTHLVAAELVVGGIPANKLIKFIKEDKERVFFEYDRRNNRDQAVFKARMSALEKIAEKHLVYPKGFKKQLWVHSFATENSVSLEKLYFIVKQSDDTQEKEELKEQFKNKALKKIPLPIKGEWFEYLWEELEEKFTELTTVGNFSYKGYSISLSVDTLQALVTKIYAKVEWKQKFRRIPNFQPLLEIMDLATFNFKEWQTFFKEYGKVIKEKNELYQNDIIRAWELLGNTNADLIFNNIDILHGMPFKNAQVAVRIKQDKNKKQQIKRFFQMGFKHYYEAYRENELPLDIIEKRYNRFFKFVNLFEYIIKEQIQNLKNKNWVAIDKFIDNYTYKGIEEGCKELAKECARCGVPENNYRDYEEWWLDNIDTIATSAREFPTITRKVSKDYSWDMSDMANPKTWVAGLDTYCCQHFHNVGGACVEYAILNPSKSGVFLVQKKGKTIAQSFTWLSQFKTEDNEESYRVLVFDNIEVTGGELKNEVIQAYQDFADRLEKYASFFKIRAIVVGKGFSDIKIEKSFKGSVEIPENHKYYAPIPSNLGYSDAKHQVLIRKFY